jgi:serine/threonine protein kinase/formylglycine-generating enzyme required for sulfatase activity
VQSAIPTEVDNSTSKLTEGYQVGGCFVLKRELLVSRGIRIWLAQDEVLGKEVTLHFVPAAVAADERAVTELRAEVKRSRQLIHPNILRVYDLVEDSGMVAVAMDRFEGESFAELLAKIGSFEPAEIRGWVQQVGETLSDAHRIQLFHRDLAPANFFNRANGGALVTNFGLSRVVAEAMERAGHLKGEGAYLSYLSPQQLDGERPSSSDDVYGLGILTYELLTGRPPFEGDGIVAKVRKTMPGSINEARAASGRTPVPANWERFVQSCTAKSADLRPKTCLDALAILDSAKTSDAGVVPEPKASAEKSPLKVEPEAKLTAAIVPPMPNPASEPAKATLMPAPAKTSAAAAQMPPTPPGNAKPKPAAALSANYPDLERPKSKLPLIGLGVAACVLAAALYFKNEGGSNTGVGSAVSRVEDSAPGAITDPAQSDLTLPVSDARPEATGPSTGNEASVDTGAPVPEIVSTEGGAVNSAATDIAEAAASQGEGRGLIGANPSKEAPKARPVSPKAASAPKTDKGASSPATNPAPAPAPVTGASKTPGSIPVIAVPPAPQPLPKLSLPQNADPEQLAKLLAERQAAAAKFEEAAGAAEKVHAANAQLREIRQEDLDAQKKALEEKRKTLTPVIKAAADVEAEKKKLEDSMAKTDAAAKEAARAAEAAKKAYEELIASSGDKAAAKEKAEAELGSVTQSVSEGSRQVEELSQAATKAEAQRQQMLLAKRQAEQEIQQLTNALEKATKAQRDAMVKANRPKINELEKQIKDVDEQLDRYQKAVASLQALNDDSTKEATQRIQEKISAANAQKSAFQEEIKRLSGVTPTAAPAAADPKPGKNSGAANPPAEAPTPSPAPPAPDAVAKNVPAPAPAAVLAKADAVPPPVPPSAAPSTPAASTIDAKDGVNSLGMKFVPVGDVEFSVYLVRRKDFEAFSKATNLKPEHWRNPGFEQSPDHPVVNVTWKEADAFCKWLTEKERKSGLLKTNDFYRLPTDSEWSKAVGLPAESGATPEDRDMRIEDVYPWGTQWPPPAGAGNFAGEETVTELPIEGYNDKFPNTSPVGAFRANAAGLYDMGGNVWQWVQDSFDGSGPAKTLRGGSWYNGAIKMSLLSSCRIKSSAETINDTYGFRIVRASDGKGKH